MSKAGVYLHIPFCRSRCSYCDFATDVYRDANAVDRYVSALCGEIENFKAEVSSDESAISNQQSETEVDTIYFGGGTPSLLTTGQTKKIFRSIQKIFRVAENAEITMEMNPATVTLESLKEYKNLGVNRASFGAQTFDDAELKRLGRRHTAADSRQTIELLRNAGFVNVSFDLIAGLPRQTVRDWERNLDEALKLKPEHLSLYLLEIHEATPLAEQIRSGRQPLPDEDLAAEMYELMLEKTSENRYAQYEISNFCLPGFESKHNSKYWTLDAVFGFGCSAHSFDGEKTRRSNERDTLKYVNLIEKAHSPVIHTEEIDAASEFVFLGLRLAKGIDMKTFKNRFGIDLQTKYSEDLRYLAECELIEFDENYLKLTEKGMIYSNEVFAAFV